MGFKKTGFGKGFVVGIGGKVEKNELPIAAAAREVKEEVFVQPSDLKLSGVMDFYFPSDDSPKSWNQRVFVYKAYAWTGSEAESDEIAPEWHPINELPFDLMWDDNRYWLEDLIAGEDIWAQFAIGNDLKVKSWKKEKLEANLDLIKRGR